MSVVSAVAVAAPPCFDASSIAPSAPETICELVHDLRQPLSSIEAIAYYLEMTLPADQPEARQYMRRLQQLVEQAELVLDRAGAAVRKQPATVRI